MALLGMKLTAKQQRIHTMRLPPYEGGEGKTRPQIAAELGISEPVVSKTITAINKKLGVKVAPGNKPVEIANPEKAAAILDAGTEPLLKVSEAMIAAGLPEKVRDSLLRRLKSKYYGVVTEVRNLKTQEILDMLGKNIHRALTYMDDKVMAEASFRDLALGTTAMIEKRALLRGEPTQIVSDHERKKLHELLPALIAEGQRRGITLEGTVMEKTVSPA